jgi:hypothetical protein
MGRNTVKLEECLRLLHIAVKRHIIKVDERFCYYKKKLTGDKIRSALVPICTLLPQQVKQGKAQREI